MEGSVARPAPVNPYAPSKRGPRTLEVAQASDVQACVDRGGTATVVDDTVRCELPGHTVNIMDVTIEMHKNPLPVGSELSGDINIVEIRKNPTSVE